MKSIILAIPMLLASFAVAAPDPADSNTRGKCPSTTGCSAARVSRNIQAAQCSQSTRTQGTQTFAVFRTNHQLDGNTGAPYGDCSAYTCAPPTAAQMQTNSDCWTFFWSNAGERSGFGTDCIKDPNTGACGCGNSDGSFVSGGTNCT